MKVFPLANQVPSWILRSWLFLPYVPVNPYSINNSDDIDDRIM